jgi:signal transduction histidine kinase
MANGIISIDVQENRDHVTITYSDNGKGILDENMDRIFEPFFTTKRNKGGTGLGLHILYNLVSEALGGQVECTSPPGHGAVFRISIPKEIQSFGKQLQLI